MASQATAQILAKGPLSTALGQWVFLGFGSFVIFTGDNGVSRAAQEIAGIAFRLATGKDAASLMSAGGLLKEAALSGSAATNALNSNGGNSQQQPIIIHSVSSSDSRGGLATTIIKLSLGAGGCWAAYIVFSNLLPDQIKEMLPVTRKFFESAVTSLGKGILMVRDTLSEQIAQLGTKQDELANKQDETHESVLGIRDDIGDVKLHVDDISNAIARCETSLTDAAGRQTYMSRGVRLLVHCVGDLMRQNNPQIAEELEQFSRLGIGELMDDHEKTRLECPGSPNLSEIGSTTSGFVVDDHHHHLSMRHLSLPGPRSAPRRSQSAVTPEGSSSRALPRANSNNYINTPSSMLSSVASPMKMPMFSNSRMNSTSTVATASSSSSGSSSRTRSTSPENEHPQSEEAMNGSRHQVALPEVENLVNMFGNSASQV